MSDTTLLNLDGFFPYQLAKLQAIISDSIAEIYTGEFDLSRQEWRILAILANKKLMSAKNIGLKANLEKMPTSRAIKKMLERELLKKANNTQDKRSSLLTLTKQGESLYHQLAPLVLQRERELISVLNKQELAVLKSSFAKLEIKALQSVISKT